MYHSELARANNKIKWGNIWWLGLYVFVFSIILVRFITYQEFTTDYLFAYYSILVTFYVLLRFGLSYFYEPEEARFDHSYTPTITFAIPAKNEEDNIYETIIKIAETNYPKEKFDIIAVNDGSTDKTFSEMVRAQRVAAALGVKVNIFDWKKNKGKREGMAACVRASKNEIIVFIDSDSFVEKETLRELVKYFAVDDSIGAVTAHTYVHNPHKNLLTTLQTIHYYISFNAYKKTESLFGTVICCPGCCTAYKLDYIRDYIDEWCKQRFLGVECTYGDDRSLTNYLLKNGYKAVFSPTAIAHTVAPHKFKVFLKQQVRWKKSWARETLLASKYFWKKNPIMVFIFYTGMLLTIVTPFILIRAFIWYPISMRTLPLSYFIGMFLISGVFSLYYKVNTGDRLWFFGFLYSFFYALVLNWLMFYALVTIRDQKWGTR